MSIHKDNATGKWRVVYRYTDWTGETHQSSKRGFPTKREAQMWERELLLKKEAKLDMTFESFYEIYVEDMQNRIRVHDLRHSHVSLLINMGFTVLAIADRMGHESIDITYRYAHLFPSEQAQMAEQLDIERMEKSNGEESGQ